MRVVFMGTPQFAVDTLEALIVEGHEVASVYTQPDRPTGRGYKLTPPPVKELAALHGITVRQPNSLKSAEEQEYLRSLSPEVIVVVAYGRLLPQAVLDIPKYGCINLHASLLPKYRGAAPIQWSVINGEQETGVCSMHMAAGLDTGDVIFTEKTEIGEYETAPELTPRLAKLGAGCIVKTLLALEGGLAPRSKQDDEGATWAPIIKKELGLIDFNKTAREISCLVRGLHGWPGAYTYLWGKRVILKEVRAAEENTGCRPGELFVLGGRLYVACGENALLINELQLEGKKSMSAEMFLRGHNINDKQKFTDS